MRDAFPPPIVVCGDCLRVSFGWMISFGRIVRGCITEFGRGGACVPARVALQGRIRRSSPAHNASIFGMETPLRERSGGHAGTAPTASFGWVMMCDEKEYNPQGGSIVACVITQGSLLSSATLGYRK